ncbi:MAG: cysteine hydrolase family protein [Clostridium sp.]
MEKALIVIDIQNDYFEGGNFPLWNTNEVLVNIKEAIRKANEKQIPIILVQHIADATKGKGLFFNEGTEGVKVHKEVLEKATDAKVVIKNVADSFHKTNLKKILKDLNVKELIICGMMTQNCVTHTAISKEAENYKVTILGDCCTTVNKPIHLMALSALSIRVPVKNIDEVFN